MKRAIEISASFSGKISTGSYENENPFFSLKESIEEDQFLITDDWIKERQKQLHSICYQQFKQRADVSYAERIAKTYQNIRFYDGANGKKYPSVTSVIGWDEDFYVSPEQLAQYGARGSVIDKQVELYLNTGEWKEPKDIPEIYPDLVILKNGSLGLVVDDVDFLTFFKEYPFKVIGLQTTHLNHEYCYGGTSDIKCVIESANKGKWEKVEGVIYDEPTILDVKSGAMDKTKFMKQVTAYAHCSNDVKQIGIIHLNKENKCGYAKPIIETNLEKYWTLFKRDRENFKKRYGI